MHVSMSAEPDPAAPPFGVNHHPQVGDPPADFDAEVPNQPGVRLGYECDGIRIANVLIEDALTGDLVDRRLASDPSVLRRDDL